MKELDDTYVAMHFALAQQLLYGRGEHQAVGIVLQLHRSEDMPAARARLASLFSDAKLDLEVRDFTELVPFYKQVIGLFGAIFTFIAVIMGVIVLFAVVNTMSMSVMERTNEIGTARAMGVRRRGIRRQFVAEGAMLGAIGATVGLILAVIIALLVNRSGLTWMPPGQAAPVPLRRDGHGDRRAARQRVARAGADGDAGRADPRQPRRAAARGRCTAACLEPWRMINRRFLLVCLRRIAQPELRAHNRRRMRTIWLRRPTACATRKNRSG